MDIFQTYRALQDQNNESNINKKVDCLSGKAEEDTYCSLCYKNTSYLAMCYGFLVIFSVFLLATTVMIVVFCCINRQKTDRDNWIVFTMFILWEIALVTYFMVAQANYSFRAEIFTYYLPLLFAYAIFGYCIFGV